MKRLLYAPVAKSFFCTLFVLSLVATIFFGMAFFAAEEKGYYEKTLKNFYETRDCENLAYNLAQEAAESFAWEEAEEVLKQQYRKEVTNVAFEIYEKEAPEELLAYNYKAEEYGYTNTWEATTYTGYGEEEYAFTDEEGNDVYTTQDPIEKTYLVKVFVVKPLQAEDALKNSADLFALLYPKRTLVRSLFICAGGIMLVSGLYLLFAAGKKKGAAEIYLNRFHRLPLEGALGILAAGILILCGIGNSYGFYNYYYDFVESIIVTMLLTGIGILLFFALFTVVIRCKAKTIWKNTFAYKILRAVKHALQMTPLIWKTVLAGATLLFLNILLFAISFSAGEAGYMMLGILIDVVVVVLLCRASYQMQLLKKAGIAIANGAYETEIDITGMFFSLREHGESLQRIRDGMEIALQEQMKSERMKTELITNVSHDIRTPLTSIMNYVDLLEKEPLDMPAQEYVGVLTRQVTKLKKLTDDLFEATKITTGNISVSLEPVNLSEMLLQAMGEYTDKFSKADLEIIAALPEEPIYAMADGRYLWRVLDNLLQNIYHYAQPETRVYIALMLMETEKGKRACISLKNISRDPLNIKAEELVERFVRGDSARTTEGSGLGLNIAENLMQLQGGMLTLSIDGDLFKAEIWL